jgi:hypothetical protein
MACLLCCLLQSGCEHCVWEVYNQELKYYMQYMQQHGVSRPALGTSPVHQKQHRNCMCKMVIRTVQ